MRRGEGGGGAGFTERQVRRNFQTDKKKNSNKGGGLNPKTPQDSPLCVAFLNMSLICLSHQWRQNDLKSGRGGGSGTGSRSNEFGTNPGTWIREAGRRNGVGGWV